MDLGQIMSMMNAIRAARNASGDAKEKIAERVPLKKEWREKFEAYGLLEDDYVKRFITSLKDFENEGMKIMHQGAYLWLDIEKELGDFRHMHLNLKKNIIEVMETDAPLSGGGSKSSNLDDKIKKYLAEEEDKKKKK